MTAEFPEIEPIEPPLPEPGWPWWAIALVSLAALALLAWAGWLAWRRWGRPAPEIPPTPRELAVAALGRLRDRMGAMGGSALSVAVADVLREFVAAEYGLPATRQTSAEFLEQAARTPWFDAGRRALLGEVMERCDLVKFAAVEATETEGARLLDEAVRFVNQAPERGGGEG